MAEKNLNTRIINKHDTEENWLKATNFIPKAGEMIIYDADTNNPLPRMKIGDGVGYVNDLEFIGDSTEIEAITIDEIDTICGTVLYAASEVLL